jgi:hypothetical protein
MIKISSCFTAWPKKASIACLKSSILSGIPFFGKPNFVRRLKYRKFHVFGLVGEG